MKHIECPLDEISQAIKKTHIESHAKAIEWVQYEARRLLLAFPNLDEFIMANGSAFFSVQNDDLEFPNGVCLPLSGYKASDCQQLSYGKMTAEWSAVEHLAMFLWELDDELEITKTPMRFTADGPVVTDW